jgi:hypothetical protein
MVRARKLIHSKGGHNVKKKVRWTRKRVGEDGMRRRVKKPREEDAFNGRGELRSLKSPT